jgi:hypothetical protein
METIKPPYPCTIDDLTVGKLMEYLKDLDPNLPVEAKGFKSLRCGDWETGHYPRVNFEVEKRVNPLRFVLLIDGDV